MISDGFGPASETFGRTMYHVLCDNKTSAWGHPTPLDRLLIGTSRTRSASSWVTDSAAGATAFSCGLKSYNGAIAVTPNMQPCATAMEAAFYQGYKTGLVVTSRITHATPAAFNAHVVWRDFENDIAEQQIGHSPLQRVTDLMFGGGRGHFIGKTSSSSSSPYMGFRNDSRDLLKEAEQKFGFQVIKTRRELDEVALKLPLLGLFANDHMSYEIDRDPELEPSLVDMTESTLKLLREAVDADPDCPGFFLMIEGSRIDMAAHSNDAATHAHEVLMYQNTVSAVHRFVEENSDTLMISTSDHETGGFSLAKQISPDYPQYQWYPEVLRRQKASTFKVAQLIKQSNSQYHADLVSRYLGISDLTSEEMKLIQNPSLNLVDLDYTLGTLVSNRAQLGWSTHGHSGVDVNLYAMGEGIDRLRGNIENTDVGHFFALHLGLHGSMYNLTTKLMKETKFKHPVLPLATVNVAYQHS
ncbi:hypothetical protein HMI55_000781 [Coelomomyces lativittatus]|nr:hypothetical protein HMI55_000781 [Coelomomyces lativittatus]